MAAGRTPRTLSRAGDGRMTACYRHGMGLGATPGRASGSDRVSAAVTRTRSVRASLGNPRHLLAPAQLVASPETGLRYRTERLLGEGGFGQVYLARRLGRSSAVPASVCIKVSQRIDAWHREAYFGQLLDGHPRAIQVFDTFPLCARGRRRPVLPRPRVRSSRRPQGIPPPHGQGMARALRAARDRGHSPGAREAAPRAGSPPRPHADERVRVRGEEPQAGGLRPRAAAERPARDDRRCPEPGDGPERHRRRRRPEVAVARRRVPGGPAARDAGEGRRTGADPNRARSAAFPAATT